MKAVWNETVVAESDATIVIEGNHYFPPDSIDSRFFEASDKRSFCPWKGEASYYDVVVGRHAQRRCCVVLPGTQRRRQRDSRLRCFLAGRRRKRLAVAIGITETAPARRLDNQAVAAGQ